MLGKIVTAIVVALFLLNGSVTAQTNGLTKYSDYKSATFRLLAMDTAGNSFITSADMGHFVRLAVDQMPTFVRGRELVKQIIVTTSKVFVDSLVHSIKSVVMTDDGSMLVIQQRPVGLMGVDYEKGQVGASGKLPSFFHYFADTLYLFPPKVDGKKDTLRIYYYQTPMFGATADSILTIARPFQIGVTFYAAYLAEIRRGVGGEQLAWKRYTDWLAAVTANVVNRPIDLLKEEKRQ